jgi:hypothetical protein
MSDVVVPMQLDSVEAQKSLEPHPNNKKADSISGGHVIRDPEFIRQLKTLHELCEFIQRRGVKIPADKAGLLEFGRIGRLRGPSWWGREQGRDPTRDEWENVEQRTQELRALLDDTCRHGFYIQKTESILIYVACVLVAVATVCLFVAISNGTPKPGRIPYCYILWLMSLGALGSVAFLAMNALSLQRDVTFDMADKELLILRMSLGAIFGLILALPFGPVAFHDFIYRLHDIHDIQATATVSQNNLLHYIPASATASPPMDVKPSIVVGAAMLLMPFVFGFSTTIVLTIINRLVDAVGVIFGRLPTVRQDGGK